VKCLDIKTGSEQSCWFAGCCFLRPLKESLSIYIYIYIQRHRFRGRQKQRDWERSSPAEDFTGDDGVE